jgi:DNA-binding GntR family transcriptional regulator
MSTNPWLLPDQPARLLLQTQPMTSPAAPSSTDQTLPERLADQLRQRIAAGELQPGQRLPEQALSDSLGVSRNTLREAFRVLTRDGLITHAPNRGVFVAIPSIASIIDIYRVRRLIECQALAQAYPRHPAKKRMRAAVEGAMARRDAADWPGVGTANMAFHMAIVELADSERLNGMFTPILAELRLAFGMLQDAEFLHAPYVDMNVKILDLTEAGRYAEAAAALNDYLVHSERIVLAVYARRAPMAG